MLCRNSRVRHWEFCINKPKKKLVLMAAQKIHDQIFTLGYENVNIISAVEINNETAHQLFLLEK